MFCDTHCHLFKEYYENIDEIIKLAKKRVKELFGVDLKEEVRYLGEF